MFSVNIRPASRNTNSTMERNRNKKVKSLGAAGRKPVNVKIVSDLRLGPPMRNFIPVRTCVRRFDVIAPFTGQAFGLQDGHNQFQVCTGVLSGKSYVDGWKLKRVRCWAPALQNTTGPSTKNAITLIPQAIDLSNNQFNDWEMSLQDSSASQSVPAYVEYVPKKGTPGAGVHFTNTVNPTGTLFSLSFRQGAGTIDIEFDYVENLVGGPLGYTSVLTTSVTGTTGGIALFGANAIPVGINQIG